MLRHFLKIQSLGPRFIIQVFWYAKTSSKTIRDFTQGSQQVSEEVENLIQWTNEWMKEGKKTI